MSTTVYTPCLYRACAMFTASSMAAHQHAAQYDSHLNQQSPSLSRLELHAVQPKRVYHILLIMAQLI